MPSFRTLGLQAGEHVSLFVCTTITRQTEEWGAVKCDVVIHFEVASFVAGYAASWDDPAAANEYEFRLTSAEFDGGEPDAAPGPITDAERATLAEWLAGDGYEKAAGAADCNRSNSLYPDVETTEKSQ